MNNRISIRPEITTIKNTESQSSEEKFQNETLRPIIKLQHDLLVAFFENYIKHSKIKWESQSLEQKQNNVIKIFKTDHKFKTELRGLVLGHFTLEEYLTYTYFSTDANKRIVTMIQEKIIKVL